MKGKIFLNDPNKNYYMTLRVKASWVKRLMEALTETTETSMMRTSQQTVLHEIILKYKTMEQQKLLMGDELL